MTTSARVTVLIVDDEPLARRGLRDMLASEEWLTCVGEAGSGTAAVEAINTLRPELVFLDIQMPGLLGTDVLRQVTHQPRVVFTTAYAEHAADAFELGALDYILKPFGADRLHKSLERVRASLGEPNSPSALDRMREALATGAMSRLFVRSGASVIPVAVTSISRFESDGDYVVAHAGRTRYMLHLSLNRLEARLDPASFTRVHRTAIVNLAHVTAFRRVDKGRVVAEFADGARVPVSRERARDLRKLGV